MGIVNGFVKEVCKSKEKQTSYYKCPNEDSFFQVLHKQNCISLFPGTMPDSREYCYILSKTCDYSSVQFCGIEGTLSTDGRCSVICPSKYGNSTVFPVGILCNGVSDCLDGEDESKEVCDSDLSKKLRCTFDKSIILSKAVKDEMYCDESEYKCGGGFFFYDEADCGHETGKISTVSKPKGVDFWWLHPIFLCDNTLEAWFNKQDCTKSSEYSPTGITCIDNMTQKERFVPDFMTCTNPAYVEGAKYQICENWEEQMNCTLNKKHVELSCNVSGYGLSSITKYLICDGIENCEDGIDEECEHVGYECYIHRHKICDETVDCLYGEDEAFCEPRKTKLTCQRKLASANNVSLSILKSYVMDNKSDCIDGADENPHNWRSCGKEDRKHYVEHDTECSENFFCGNDREHVMEPVPMDNLCDMKSDCPGEREMCFISRQYKKVWSDSLKIDNKVVIPPCLPGLSFEDNFRCIETSSTDKIYKLEPQITVHSSIKQSCRFQFGEQYIFLSCRGLCLENNVSCKLRHAPQNACSQSSTKFANSLLILDSNNTEIIKVSQPSPGMRKFKDNVFLCDNRHCVTNDKVCNLANDCGDESDEVGCINQFRCNTSSERLSLDKLCDGVVNCVDFSDECNEACPKKRIIISFYLQISAWVIGVASTVINILVIFKSVYKLSKMEQRGITFRDNLLILLIAFGDLLVGIYLVMISGVNHMLGEDYCHERYIWTASTMCHVLGVLSTIGSQISLFTMTVLSIFRVYRITHLFSAPNISKPWWIFTILLCILIVTSATLISVTPLFDNFEDFFLNGLSYHEITLFVGLVKKSVHFDALETYYGKLWGMSSHHISWSLIRSLIKDMFSSDDGIVQGNGVGFYGNAGVCLFKYFVTEDDPQRLFSLCILFLNFFCFGVITVSYIIVLTVSRISIDGLNNNVADNTNSALQKKISLIILSDALCWIPFILIGILHYFQTIDASPLYGFCSIIILPVNSLINPIIYNSEFREYKDMLSNFCRRCFRRLRTGDNSSDQTSTTNLAMSAQKQRCSDIRPRTLTKYNDDKIEMSETCGRTILGQRKNVNIQTLGTYGLRELR